MACKIINQHTGEVISEHKDIPSYDKWYEFDSGEEALLEMIVAKNWLMLTDKTLFTIKAIVQPLEINGVILPTHFYWRKYIFSELGRIFGYVGEMQETNKEKPDLTLVKWNLYSEEERKKHLISINKSLGVDPQMFEDNEVKVIATNESLPTKFVQRACSDKTVYYVYIYLLYCDETPNIYYVGRTKSVESRYQTHISNSPKLNTKPKYEWVEFIRKSGYELKHKVLETVPEHEGSACEYKYIKQYFDVKENVMLNFTAPVGYSSDNVIFLHKLRKCLYEKQIIVINNYEDISQIADIKPINIPNINITNADPYSLVYALYCDDTPHIYYIGYTRIDMERRMRQHLMPDDGIGSNNCYKNEWVDYIKKNNYELKYKVLETPPLYDLQIRGNFWKNEYIADKNNVVLNFCTAYYKVKNKIIIARFKTCLYEKKLIIVDNYDDLSQIEGLCENN